jgi:flagellin-specific chaperone FliS
MLHRLAMNRIRDARRCLEAGDDGERAKAIAGAMEVLAEIARSINRRIGGGSDRPLAQLHEYMRCRLADATLHQSAEPLNEVLSLLSALSEVCPEIDSETFPVAHAAHSRWFEDSAAETGQPAPSECCTV